MAESKAVVEIKSNKAAYTILYDHQKELVEKIEVFLSIYGDDREMLQIQAELLIGAIRHIAEGEGE